MNEFDEILKEINKGKEGKNNSVSLGFSRLDPVVSIRKKVMTLIFGATGSGKSTWTNSAFILNTFDWWLANNKSTTIKIKPILFAAERSKIYTKTKWLTRKIFVDTGTLIPLPKIMGWWENSKLTAEEHDLILSYADYINELMEFVTVVEGANNPTGYRNYMLKYFDEHGNREKISEFEEVYTQSDESELVIPIIDHINLTKAERGFDKKQSIDKLTEYAQEWRDKYHCSPVFVAQMNRDLGNVQYQRLGDFEPTVDQIKDSSSPADAADVVISLFDPIRYSTKDKSGYEAEKFINQKNQDKPFRSLKILKNTYGIDGVRLGTVMHGAAGIFKQLPKPKEIEDTLYDTIHDGSYFTTAKAEIEFPSNKIFMEQRLKQRENEDSTDY
jgi:hypothetical protein